MEGAVRRVEVAVHRVGAEEGRADREAEAPGVAPEAVPGRGPAQGPAQGAEPLAEATGVRARRVPQVAHEVGVAVTQII